MVMSQAVLHFLRANQRSLLEMLLSSLLVNAFALTLPLFSMLVYDKAMGNEIHDTLWALAAGVVLLFALELVLRTSRIFIIEHAGAHWDTHLDERLMRGILAAPISKALPIGDVLSRYRELSNTRDVLSAQCLLPLADLPFLLLFVLVVAAIGGPLVFIPLGMGAALIALNVGLQAVSQHRHKDSLHAHARKLNWLVDVLTARESLMSQAASSVAINGYRQPVHAGARAASKARLWSQISQQITPIAMSLTSVILLVAGVFRVEAQALSVGGLISVNMLGGRILSLMCAVAPMVAKWKDFNKALRDLHETVDFHAESPDTLAAATNALKQEGLRLDGVSFGYASSSRAVLDGLNLQLRAGELVAIVGSSGAGKSTLLRLLAGHIFPTQGQYAYGGHLIDSDRQRRWLCAQVNYKPQDPSYLGGTLAEIIAPGDDHGNDASLLQSLRKAGLGPALDRNELALNTVVGTNGTGLSGGQRQMLAMARVFHSSQEMVLLDEPTLGLDRAAQDQVLRELRPMAQQGRCVVVATHAAEVIELADRVLVLDRGRIVADAPPGCLLGAKPTAMPATQASGTGHVVTRPLKPAARDESRALETGDVS
jgi:ABC-type bacteriocin/lantibiotic exporter with double-glycine peptidase domain